MGGQPRKNLPVNLRYRDDTAHNSRKSDTSTTSVQSYRQFVAQYPGFCPSRYNIADYQNIIGELNDYYTDYMIATGNMVILPNGMGKMVVRKFKKPLIQKADGMLNQKIDWNETKKTGKYVYYTNDHTDGNSFAWMWIKNKVTLSTYTMWKMKPTSICKKKLVEYIKSGGNWEKFHYITDSTREYLIRKRLKREQEARDAKQ